MANHILGNKDLMKYLTVMHHKGKTDELGNYCAPSRPGLYRFTRIGFNVPVDLGEQLLIDEWTFFKRPSHFSFLVARDSGHGATNHALQD